MNGVNMSIVSLYCKSWLKILNSDELFIHNLLFKYVTYSDQQQGLDITNTQTVLIRSCAFIGSSNKRISSSSYTSLKVNEAKHIILDSITAKGISGRAVYTESSLSMTVLNSEFKNNAGDVVCINSTNTMITSSRFHSNTGKVLTISSVTTSLTKCNITNNSHVNHYYEGDGAVILITLKHNQLSKDSTNRKQDCSLHNFYNVVTRDTVVELEGKTSSDSCLLFTNNATKSDHMSSVNASASQFDCDNCTPYFCTNLSDVFASNLTSISNANEILFHFTASSASSSHGNRGRLCVNTDQQHTLRFTNRIAFCDDKTILGITKYKTHNVVQEYSQTSSAVSEGVSANCRKHKTSCENCTHKENIDRNYDTSRLHNDLGDVRQTVAISDCVFDNNHAAGYIGVVHVHMKNNPVKNRLANVLISSCIFTNNSLAFKGGVISIGSLFSQESVVQIIFCTFNNNFGGAVLINMNVQVTIRTFINNNGWEDLGISMDGDGFQNASILIAHCTFNNNTSSYGGAIHFKTVHYQKDVRITSCNFISNRSYKKGGAIWHAGGTTIPYSGSLYSVNENFLITSCSFINNTSDEGGAIYMDPMSKQNVLITSCIFTNNTSSENGGAISLKIMQEQSINRNILITSSVFTNNTSQLERGGAISISCGSRLNSINTLSNIFITSCNFTNNTSQERGGAIYILNYSKSTFSIKNVLIAFCTLTNNTSKDGGAISIYSRYGQSIGENVLFFSCTFIDNSSQKHGGAIYINSYISEKVIIISCSFTNNTSQVNGGAIYIYPTTLYIIKSNVLIASCTFTNNTSQSKGGAIAIDCDYVSGFRNENVLITSCSFTNNTSLQEGGAIYLLYTNSQEYLTGRVLITSCTFFNNTSLLKRGGALYLTIPDASAFIDIRIKYCQFNANSARGIFLLGVGNATVEYSNFINNEYSVINLQQSTITF